MRRRGVLAGVAVLAACASLAGCASDGGPAGTGPEMTADQAMTRPVTIGRAVIAALGTTPWTLTIGPDAEPCTLADGGTGMTVTWSARGPASSASGEDADVAARTLRERALSATVQHVGGGGARVVARSRSFGVVEFDASATSTSVVATTACVEGDAEHYRDARPQGPTPPPSSS